MTQTLRAVYEKGVLRPLAPLTLQENQQITITLSEENEGCWPDDAFLRYLEAEADDSVTLDQVRTALAKIPGSMSADFHRERDERQ